MTARLVLVLLLCLVACSPVAVPRDASEPSCDAGAVRVCGCGPLGLDGVGEKRCVVDVARGVWSECSCDAG